MPPLQGGNQASIVVFFPRQGSRWFGCSCFLRALDLTRPLILGNIMENFTGFLFGIGCFVFAPQFLGIYIYIIYIFIHTCLTSGLSVFSIYQYRQQQSFGSQVITNKLIFYPANETFWTKMAEGLACFSLEQKYIRYLAREKRMCLEIFYLIRPSLKNKLRFINE